MGFALGQASGRKAQADEMELPAVGWQGYGSKQASGRR